MSLPASPNGSRGPGSHGRPVFTDPSGRRVRRMRLFGMAAGGVLVACLCVMAVGLLGGPAASVIGWGSRPAGGSAGAPRTGGGRGAAAPSATLAAAAPIPSSGRSASRQAGHSSSPSPSPSAAPAPSAAPSPSPTVTNRAGKKPPGRNRTPRPSPSRAHGG